jgi:DNA-directed RNA polymerase specialized sigma24 family protein
VPAEYDEGRGVGRSWSGVNSRSLPIGRTPAKFVTSEGSITRWIDLVKQGHDEGAERLWQTYFGPMVALARRKLGEGGRRGADEEDVALSAFKSFCLGARQGRFDRLADRDNLWPLLVSITVHKSVDLVRRENRAKRGGGATVELSPSASDGADSLALLSREPTPEFAAQLSEGLAQLIDKLTATGDEQLPRIALWRMEGDSTVDIAGRLGCVRRTVERKLQVIARLWEEEDVA